MRALYLKPTGELGVVENSLLAQTTERHKLSLTVIPTSLSGNPIAVLRRDSSLAGLIIEMYVGWVGRDTLALIRQVLRLRRRVWLCWPGEEAIECVDRERLAS